MNVLKPHLQTTVATLLTAGKSQREIGRITVSVKESHLHSRDRFRQQAQPSHSKEAVDQFR